MEQTNPDAQQQIWQRVFAPPESPRESLHPLIMSAREQTGLLGRLAASLTTGREEANRLYRESWDTVTTLVGLERLRGGTAEALKPGPHPRESARRLLEKSYHQARQAMAEYMAHSLDPELGIVFRQLAQREEAHCAAIARLLGMQ